MFCSTSSLIASFPCLFRGIARAGSKLHECVPDFSELITIILECVQYDDCKWSLRYFIYEGIGLDVGNVDWILFFLSIIMTLVMYKPCFIYLLINSHSNFVILKQFSIYNTTKKCMHLLNRCLLYRILCYYVRCHGDCELCCSLLSADWAAGNCFGLRESWPTDPLHTFLVLHQWRQINKLLSLVSPPASYAQRASSMPGLMDGRRVRAREERKNNKYQFSVMWYQSVPINKRNTTEL